MQLLKKNMEWFIKNPTPANSDDIRNCISREYDQDIILRIHYS